MHELSLCASVYQIAEKRAGERRVAVIHLRIGRLRQVIPETLEYCWTLVSQDTDLDGARLDIDSVPVNLLCRDCGQESSPRDHLLLCGLCGAGNVEVTAGEEFVLTSLEFAEV